MYQSKICCTVKSFCGRSLHHGVLMVGVITIVVSILMFLLSIIVLTSLVNNDNKFFNQHPLKALNLIFCLVCCGISLYQIFVSSLLIYQALKLGGNVFLCSLWFTSHLSVLAVYGFLFLGITVSCFVVKDYISGVAMFVGGAIYEGYNYFFGKKCNDISV